MAKPLHQARNVPCNLIPTLAIVQDRAWCCNREAADRLMQYVVERRAMIQYPEICRRGWQIGSRLTEAECKAPTHRLKGRGRRGNPQNAEAMTALACPHDSRLWDAYRQTPDHERYQARHKTLAHTVSAAAGASILSLLQ